MFLFSIYVFCGVVAFGIHVWVSLDVVGFCSLALSSAMVFLSVSVSLVAFSVACLFLNLSY